MTRPRDMGPADLAPNTAPPDTMTPEEAERSQRNAYYNALPPAAKETFLEVISSAAERGATEEEAWEQAVRAVEGRV